MDTSSNSDACSSDEGAFEGYDEDEQQRVEVWEPPDDKEEDAPPVLLDDTFLESLRWKPSDEAPSGAIEFMVMDVQVRQDRAHGTGVVLFGRTADGGSLCVTLTCWYPYLYIQAPVGWVDLPAHKDCVRLAIAEALAFDLDSNESLKRALHQFSEPILSIETVKATSVMGFEGCSNQQQTFLKQRVASPLLLRPLRSCWERRALSLQREGIPQITVGGNTPTFNSNLDPVLQFMVDKGLSGCQWCSVPLSHAATRTTRCHYELEASADALCVLPARDDLAPLRLLSFDLEAAGRRGVFPDPTIDPVIQISVHMEPPSSEQQLLLSFKECHPIPGATVLSFEREESLLLAFRDVVCAYDPDLLTGFNILNFDLEYLQKRAQALGIGSEFACMTRLRPPKRERAQGPQYMQVKERFFQSAQVGKRKTNSVLCSGRVVLDVYPWVLNNFRLESYKLDSVCKQFLPAGVTKEDLHFTEITPKWMEGPEGRRQLGVYCLKDAELPLTLIQSMNILFNAVERARVIGIPLEYVLSRGALIRFTSQLMRECSAQGYLLPFVDENSPLRRHGCKYEGAMVLPVKRGLHTRVVTLDFSSMYPSIIIASNLCYSTLYKGGLLRDVPTTFHSHCFVGQADRVGVLPSILLRMLDMRKQAKAAFQAETHPIRKRVLAAREQGIKVFCNSMYGGMGSPHALLPGRPIAETTTGLGRQDIAQVKAIAEGLFTQAQGYSADAQVVCGDTDSVFVRMPTHCTEGLGAIKEAIQMGLALADAINQQMKTPKRIAFEKVFEHLLVIKKKRYAGYKYENVTDSPLIDIKGIECVRRDGCPLIRDTVRMVAQHLASTADVDGASEMVRSAVRRIMQDEVEIEQYAIRKVLRKSIQDCSHPLLPSQLATIRTAIQSPYKDDDEALPLTEEEIDRAISMGVAVPWNLKVKLPHVLVAWKMRLKDPRSAPVLGEPVEYIITQNAEKLISGKAQPLAFAKQRGLPVDRHFYLATLRKAIDGLFTPIIEQRLGPSVNVKREAERMLWSELLEGRLTRGHRQEQRASPIAQAFLMAAPSPKRAVPNMPPTALAVNQAERSQMRARLAQKQEEEMDKKKASKAQSPLLKAFARQALKKSI